jgi:hypothetical protein
VYLNDEVNGPYAVDQLIRLRGFSRQTQVCVDDESGKPKNWISLSEIPELAHIFKAADERMAESPAPSPKAAPKTAAPRPIKPFVPAVTLKKPMRNNAALAGWILLAAAILGGAWLVWSQHERHALDASEKRSAQALIENVHLPAPSPYGTLPQYFQEKDVHPRWEFEKMQDGLYHVTVSWYAPSLTVYAFEVNTQAQTVRGLNSAATKLLSDGFPAPSVARVPSESAPKKSPDALFAEALESHRAAIESGDFQSVWSSFSHRKKSDMARAGMSKEGFVRLQGLTHRVESALKQQVLKTKQDSDTEMLVLIKQTQDGQPDIFVKQLWVFENGTWKLDDEQKKSAALPAPDAETKTEAVPSQPAEPANPPVPAVAPAKLPGMSN